MNDVSYLPIGDLLASLPSDAVVRVLVPTAIEGGNAFDLKEEFVFANKLSASGKLTITPVITAGAGASSEDWTFMWTRQGNNITAHFLCRDVTIPSGVTTVTMTLELNSTVIAPSSNFTGAFNFTGNGAANSLNLTAGVVSSASINTVNASKKLQFSIGLTAAASGDFTTSVGGSIAFEIVPS